MLPLRVSFIGYESKEVWVPRGGASNLRVVLSQGIFALDEVGVNGYFNSTKHSFIAGMMTTFAKGDNILVPQGWFRVEGCVEDENGEPLSGVVIYRKRKGKNFPECRWRNIRVLFEETSAALVLQGGVSSTEDEN